MKKKKLFMLLIPLAAVLVIFIPVLMQLRQSQLKNYYKSLNAQWSESQEAAAYDLSEEAGTEEITDAQATQFLQDLYGLTELTDQKLYRNEDVVQMLFYFPEDVPFYQVDEARSFVLQKFVLKLINNYSRTPYEDWILKEKLEEDFSAVSCKIYIGERVAVQDNYEGQKLTGSYENFSDIFSCRKIQPEKAADMTAAIRSCLPGAGVTYQKSFFNQGLIIGVDTEKYPEPEKIEELTTYYRENPTEYSELHFVFYRQGEPFMQMSLSK